MRLRPETLPATGSARADLLLLHGWGSGRDVWRPLVAELRPWANITLVDIPGLAPGTLSGTVPGASPGLDEVLDALLAAAPERAVYLGFSLGGQLALELARRAPQRVQALATLCSNLRFVAPDGAAGAAGVGTHTRVQSDTAWPGMDAGDFEAFRERARSDPVRALRRFDALQVAGSGAARGLLRVLRPEGAPAVDAGMAAGLDWLARLDARAWVADLAPPRLHLFAGRDALVPGATAAAVAALDETARARAAARTRAVAAGGAARLVEDGATGCGQPPAAGRVALLAAACHLVPVDCPAEVATRLATFLDDLGASPAARPGATAAAPGTTVAPLPPEAPIPKAAVAASFGRAAATYDAVARLQQDVGTRLLGTLDGQRLTPRTVLDLGCGTGYFAGALRARFPGAKCLGLDLAEGMVGYASRHQPRASCWLVADAEALPLARSSVDLVFSSLTLQWCARPDLFFAELARVLSPGGQCVFTTLGPATLFELRAAWAEVDAHQHVNRFLPARALETAAVAVPGVELRLQAHTHRLYYRRVRDLMAELKALGAHNMNAARPAGLSGRRGLQTLLAAYERYREGGSLPATYEVLYGTLVRAP